jgi:hypothetical protein
VRRREEVICSGELAKNMCDEFCGNRWVLHASMSGVINDGDDGFGEVQAYRWGDSDVKGGDEEDKQHAGEIYK